MESKKHLRARILSFDVIRLCDGPSILHHRFLYGNLNKDVSLLMGCYLYYFMYSM